MIEITRPTFRQHYKLDQYNLKYQTKIIEHKKWYIIIRFFVLRFSFFISYTSQMSYIFDKNVKPKLSR